MDLLICARMGSSRLPGKALMEIGDGMSSLDIIVEKAKSVGTISKMVLATTTNHKDNELVRWAEKKGVGVFRGDEDDVLGRIKGAADKFNLSHIVEILGDNPLVPIEMIKNTIEKYKSSQSVEKYVATATSEYKFLRGKSVFPIGIRVQTFSKEFLLKLDEHAETAEEREHATSYIYERADFSNIDFVWPERELSSELINHNFAINTKEQHRVAREIFKLYGINCNIDQLASWKKKNDVTK